MSAPGMVTIYGLVDPRSEVVRYIGQTIRLGRRVRQHVEMRHANGNLGLLRWISELRDESLIPRPLVLEVVSLGRADERERYWIRVHLAEDVPLLNVCDGGPRTVTKALHVSKGEWLDVGRRLRALNRELQRLHVQVANGAGVTRAATRDLQKALHYVSQARSGLEDLLRKVLPEWASDVSEAFYGDGEGEEDKCLTR